MCVSGHLGPHPLDPPQNSGDEVYFLIARFNSLALLESVEHCQYLGVFYPREMVHLLSQNLGNGLPPPRLVQFVRDLFVKDKHRRLLKTQEKQR